MVRGYDVAKKLIEWVAEPATFAVGDEVEIAHWGPGTISEIRGNLGPHGQMVYGVHFGPKRRPGYIEVLGSELRHRKPAKKPKPAAGEASV